VGKSGVALRLEKWLENWYDLNPEDANFMVISPNQIVKKDVSNIPDEQLSEMLDDLHYELIPEDFEEVEDESDG
jgi:division protein CdvB (Snf7/Vps24/ESCRT-III family)